MSASSVMNSLVLGYDNAAFWLSYKSIQNKNKNPRERRGKREWSIAPSGTTGVLTLNVHPFCIRSDWLKTNSNKIACESNQIIIYYRYTGRKCIKNPKATTDLKSCKHSLVLYFNVSQCMCKLVARYLILCIPVVSDLFSFLRCVLTIWPLCTVQPFLSTTVVYVNLLHK